jgi:hypothetical protein
VVLLLVRGGGVVIGINAGWLQKDPVFLPELLLVLLLELELVLLGFQGGRRQQVGGAAISTSPKESTRLHSSRRQRVGSRQEKGFFFFCKSRIRSLPPDTPPTCLARARIACFSGFKIPAPSGFASASVRAFRRAASFFATLVTGLVKYPLPCTLIAVESE